MHFFLSIWLFSLPFALQLQAADALTSKTTYQKAYGESKGSPTVDVAKELPHYPAVEPADAVATWNVKKGFRLQLSAHEPLVCDPIAICFDERGRMFVCEMIDYSEMREADPHLGRISVLEDKDGDGYYESSHIFADNLPWPTGLIWANGGLYVAATPDIWRLEDHNGDDIAEFREKVFTGFGTGLKILNVQSLANSLQWGPDNRIHLLAGGGNRGKISCSRRAELTPQELSGRDFWFDPLTYDFGLEPGGAQYGMSYDDYGRKFGCSNSDHLQFWVHNETPSGRNPITPLPPGRNSIAKDGGAAEVFRLSPDEPWRIIRTRWRIAGTVPGAVEGGGRVSGYFTGATGTTIYRGDAYGPAFLNNSFTGDAGGQLIHRKIIKPTADGVSLQAERPEDELNFEFAASRDTWVRPVNFANAPDGCLYVCDMYREIIEHPWSIPDEIKKNLDLNRGNDRGRIYRILPEGGLKAGRNTLVDLSKATSAELVRTLAHPNGWHRDTASRLLVEKHPTDARPLIENTLLAAPSPLARLHALSILEATHWLNNANLLVALKDQDAYVRQRGLILLRHRESLTDDLAKSVNALAHDADSRVRFECALTIAGHIKADTKASLTPGLRALALRDHSNAWISAALLSAPPQILYREIFSSFMADRKVAESSGPFFTHLIEIAASVQPAAQRAELIRWLTEGNPNALWFKALNVGLTRAGSSLIKSDSDHCFAVVFAHATQICGDSDQPLAQRLNSLEILAVAPFAVAEPTLKRCLGPGQLAEIQIGSLRIIGSHASPAVTEILLSSWPSLQPAARDTLFSLLLGRPDRTAQLLESISKSRIAGNALSPSQIQNLLRHPQEKIRRLAEVTLRELIPPSRQEVILKLQSAGTLKGDGVKGLAVYQQRCLPCHRAGSMGVNVGPDLITVKTKGREALLTAILDPNKEIAAQYATYTVTTKQGEIFNGIIVEDNATGLTLKFPGGATQTIARSDIKGSSSNGQSLMPDGLEAGLAPQDLADLLTFIEELK